MVIKIWGFTFVGAGLDHCDVWACGWHVKVASKVYSCNLFSMHTCYTGLLRQQGKRVKRMEQSFLSFSHRRLVTR